MKRTISMAVMLYCACLLVFVLVGFGVWKSGWLQTGFSERTTPKATEEKSELPPMSMLVPENTTAGEFAGDMHRPEGFHKNIGSALALKMTVVEDENYQFRVVTYTCDDTMEELVTLANQNLDAEEKIDFCTFRTILIVNEHAGGKVEAYPWSMYFCTLTAEQIYAMAETGAICQYVGSGEGKEDVDWNTCEGIDAFCEWLGDQYVMGDNENQIKSYPDLWAE